MTAIKETVCYYHGADLDGHCSGAIVEQFFSYYRTDLGSLMVPLRLVPIDYQDKWVDPAPDQSIIMLDFSLKPEQMARVAQLAGNFLWIDHHVTAIRAVDDYFERHSLVPIPGLRRNDCAACLLTWEYFFPGKPVPQGVIHLSNWDIWKHDSECELFQYAMRSYHTDPRGDVADYLWQSLLSDASGFIATELKRGEACLEYEIQVNAKFAQAYCFETELAGLKAVAANRGMAGSFLFKSVLREEHKLRIAFVMCPGGDWRVSLYSDHPEVHCGEICATFGGGGHKGAAGFITKELPFKIGTKIGE